MGLELQIDVMVFNLYELTFDEVLVVDPNFESKMSRKEYEAFKFS